VYFSRSRGDLHTEDTVSNIGRRGKIFKRFVIGWCRHYNEDIIRRIDGVMSQLEVEVSLLK